MLLDNSQLNKNRYMLHTLITDPLGVDKRNLVIEQWTKEKRQSIIYPVI